MERTLTQQLDAADDERGVRDRLANRQYHSDQIPVIEEWLRRKVEARTQAAAAKRDALEEESLAVDKATSRATSEAAISARSAARWAMWAAIIAITAVAIANKDQILALIFGNS